MNFKLLDGMVVFVEVVNNGSFTMAARKSGHSTSYISKEISKLEERLGVRLLNRTTRSLSLTPEGELYYRQSQQIVDDAEQTQISVEGKEQEPKGLLRISCPTSFGLSRLRPVLAQFTARYPHVSLELELNDRKIDMVAEGFDILIRASQQLEDSSLISRRFMRSRSVVIASPKYLETHGVPERPEELSEHQTINYSNLKQPKIWVFRLSSGNFLQVPVEGTVLTNSSEMELSLCLAGQGITRLPLFNIGDEIDKGLLVELFPSYPVQIVDVFLVYPSRKQLSSKVRSFIEFIVDKLGDN